MRAQTASASFSRPANTTQYAVGDMIANTIAGDSGAGTSGVVAMNFPAGPYIIRRVRLFKNDDDVTAATFRAHFFQGDPRATLDEKDTGDNGAFKLSGAPIAEYIGSYDLDMTSSPDIYRTNGNACTGVPLNGSELIVPAYRTASSAQIGTYALLEARATYTPASGETFTLTIEYLV